MDQPQGRIPAITNDVRDMLHSKTTKVQYFSKNPRAFQGFEMI